MVVMTMVVKRQQGDDKTNYIANSKNTDDRQITDKHITYDTD